MTHEIGTPHMIKRIAIDKLQPGMYIHDLNCGWMEHNFLRSRFAVKTEADARKVRALGVHEIYIDTARGLDLPEALTREAVETEVDEKIEAIVAERAPVLSAREVASEVERARALQREANLIVRDMMGDIRLGKQIELEQVEPLVERIVDSIFTQQDALLPLARLKQHVIPETILLQQVCGVQAAQTATDDDNLRCLHLQTFPVVPLRWPVLR